MGEKLEDSDFLEKLIMEMARQAVGGGSEGEMTILVPAGPEPETASGGPSQLARFVGSITEEMLSKGIAFESSPGMDKGIKLRLEGEDLQVDLTDKALTDALLRHLLPRFRAIVEGVGH